LQFLVDHYIFFEAYAIDMAGTAHEYARLPVPLRELYEKALEFARSNEKSISDHFAELPFSQQKILEQTLRKIDPKFRNQPPWGPLGTSVVVALEWHIHHPPRKSALHRLKAFFGSENSKFRGSCMRITLLRLLQTEEEEEAKEEEEKKGQEEGQAEKSAAKQLAEAAEAAARVKAMSETAAATATPTLVPPTERKEPVQFKDALGRKFSFPFEFCCTWKVCPTPCPTTVNVVETIGG
jgi:hypothetical protein